MQNTQGISYIEFTRTIRPFCPLGNDTFDAKITVSLQPDKELFDFCEMDRAIQALSSRRLIAEDVANEVYNLVMAYKPLNLSVRVDAESNTHFPVTVIKE